MHFIFTGFHQEMGYRVFSFERIGEDRSNTPCIIRADLELALKYGIRIQELPLLCREVLARAMAGHEGPLTFTEDDMRRYQGECADARKLALQRKKPARRVAPHPVDNTSNKWASANANKTPPAHMVAASGRD